jgi:hypothetical protein
VLASIVTQSFTANSSFHPNQTFRAAAAHISITLIHSFSLFRAACHRYGTIKIVGE